MIQLFLWWLSNGDFSNLSCILLLLLDGGHVNLEITC